MPSQLAEIKAVEKGSGIFICKVYFSFFLCTGTLTLLAKSAGGLSNKEVLDSIPDSNCT